MERADCVFVKKAEQETEKEGTAAENNKHDLDFRSIKREDS